MIFRSSKAAVQDESRLLLFTEFVTYHLILSKGIQTMSINNGRMTAFDEPRELRFCNGNIESEGIEILMNQKKYQTMAELRTSFNRL